VSFSIYRHSGAPSPAAVGWDGLLFHIPAGKQEKGSRLPITHRGKPASDHFCVVDNPSLVPVSSSGTEFHWCALDAGVLSIDAGNNGYFLGFVGPINQPIMYMRPIPVPRSLRNYQSTTSAYGVGSGTVH
jgi:hypothetical protein